MDKIIFFEGKTSVGAERIAQALAQNMDVAYIDKNSHINLSSSFSASLNSIIPRVFFYLLKNILDIY